MSGVPTPVPGRVPPLKRYAFVMRLREGSAPAYDRAHHAVWPEMIELLMEAGVHDYSIFRRDNLLVLTLRAADFEETWSRIENDPVNLRWQQAMEPLFAPPQILHPGERFPMMHEVFHMQ